MVRLPSTLELLVEAGSSPAEQYELLRRVRCLSPLGLAGRAAVLALLEGVARDCAAVAVSPELAQSGGPTSPQIQVSELRAAGYLDPAGCAAFDEWPGEQATVDQILAEARAVAQLPITPPDDMVDCRTCGRRLPASARYCGHCGIRLA